METPVDSEFSGDDVDRLVVECLRLAETVGLAVALDRIVAANPERAATVRRRIEALECSGLVSALAIPRPPARTAGSRIGAFRLVRALGGGGMGIVYLAKDEALARTVAVKLVRPENLLFPESLERFRREIRIVARLQHPGIVPILSIGEEHGAPFLVMERILGRSLAEILHSLGGRSPADLQAGDLLAAARIPAEGGARIHEETVLSGSWESALVRVAIQMANALDYAHDRGVQHRDVKPSNIMLTPTGRAILVDFGLARVDDAAPITRSTAALGSLPYMSPEQILSGGRAVDRRTDVYSLGVTLYECLTLRSPYSCESTDATRKRILDGNPPLPRSLNPAVSWDAETVVLKAMDRDPNRRYATAREFARDLANVLAHRPVAAQRSPVEVLLRRWVQRHPAATAAIAVGALALAGFGGVVAWTSHAAYREVEGLSRINESRMELARNPGGALRLALDGARFHPGSAADSALILALNACWERATFRLGGSQASFLEFDLSGCRTEFVVGCDDGTIRMLSADAATAAPKTVRASDHAIRIARLDTRRNRLLAAAANELRLLDATTLETVCVCSQHGGAVRAAEFLPSDDRIVTACDDGNLRVIDGRDGTVIRSITLGPRPVLSVSLHADGTRALATSNGPCAFVVDLSSGEILLELTDPESTEPRVTCAAWSPDGGRIATGSGDGSAALFEGVDGSRVRRLTGHEREIVQVVFSPDGRWLATASNDGTVRLADVATGDKRVLSGHKARIAALDFSPDSRLLATASADTTARLFDVATGSEIASFLGHTSGLTDVGFSPGGNRLATSSSDGTARLWDVESSLLHASRALHGAGITTIAVSVDGRRVATGAADGTISVIAIDAESRVERVRPHAAAVETIRFDSDGGGILSISSDRNVRVWDSATETGRSLAKLPNFVKLARTAGSTGGYVIAHGSRLVEFDSTGARRKDYSTHEGVEILDFTFAGDGTLLAAEGDHFVSDGTSGAGTYEPHLLVLDCGDGSCLAALRHGRGQRFGCVSSGPEGVPVAAGASDGTVRIWPSGIDGAYTDVPCAERREPLIKVVCDRLGKRIATLSSYGSIRIVDLSTLRVSKVGLSAASEKTELSWSDDGARLLVFHVGRATVWDAERERSLVEFGDSGPECTGAAWLPGDGRVATGHADGRLRFWIIPEDLVEAAERALPRQHH